MLNSELCNCDCIPHKGAEVETSMAKKRRKGGVNGKYAAGLHVLAFDPLLSRGLM